MNSNVDFYFNKAKQWQHEIEALRTIVIGCGLTEELKWGCPCYTFQNNNVVLIHVFKEYCALLFFKGALLHNDSKLLIQQTKHVQAARQIRFTEVGQITEQQSILKAYILEAVEVEKAGLKVAFKKQPEPVTAELQDKFDEMPALQTAFEALTPGRQRAYILYFLAPKQSKTRALRVEKCVPLIIAGKGLNDE